MQLRSPDRRTRTALPCSVRALDLELFAQRAELPLRTPAGERRLETPSAAPSVGRRRLFTPHKHAEMKGPSVPMLVLAASCLLACLPLAQCDKEPVISQISEEKIKEIGEEVEFNCTVQNTQDYPILWIKLDKDRLDRAPLSSDANLIIRDKRFSVKFDPAASTYSLKIKDLQESDTGFYQCQVLITVNNKVTAEVELQIRRPSMISSNSTRSVNVTEGKPIELRCNADGFPVPSISWRRENDLLLPTGGAVFQGPVLKIASAHRDDRGVYYCVATNGVGGEARANATVQVDFAPVITAVRPRVGQSQGYEASLECRVEAHPRATVVWLRRGVEVRRAEAPADAGDEYVDALKRYSVGADDYGEYVCRAENKLGSAETKVELFESIVPVCASPCG